MLSSDRITAKVNRLREITKLEPKKELQEEAMNLTFELLENFLLAQHEIHKVLIRT